jgi:hypothetical protein
MRRFRKPKSGNGPGVRIPPLPNCHYRAWSDSDNFILGTGPFVTLGDGAGDFDKETVGNPSSGFIPLNFSVFRFIHDIFLVTCRPAATGFLGICRI